MPKTSLISLNANTGAFTAITASIPARRVEIREDESVTAQGLQYQKPDDNFATTYQCGTPGSPDQPQITLGNVIGNLTGRGPILAMPDQSGGKGASGQTAGTYVKVRSASGSTTKVRVVEHE